MESMSGRLDFNSSTLTPCAGTIDILGSAISWMSSCIASCIIRFNWSVASASIDGARPGCRMACSCSNLAKPDRCKDSRRFRSLFGASMASLMQLSKRDLPEPLGPVIAITGGIPSMRILSNPCRCSGSLDKTSSLMIASMDSPSFEIVSPSSQIPAATLCTTPRQATCPAGRWPLRPTARPSRTSCRSSG